MATLRCDTCRADTSHRVDRALGIAICKTCRGGSPFEGPPRPPVALWLLLAGGVVALASMTQSWGTMASPFGSRDVGAISALGAPAVAAGALAVVAVLVSLVRKRVWRGAVSSLFLAALGLWRLVVVTGALGRSGNWHGTGPGPVLAAVGCIAIAVAAIALLGSRGISWRREPAAG